MHTLFDPLQIMEETSALFAESENQKGLRVEVAWRGPECAGYWGDPIRLRQMLSNLASNAVKFTDAGYIRIEGTEVERNAGQAALEFSVSDSGVGVPQDKQSMLFQPFTQVDGSSTRRFGGTGLGLSIVRSLAQMMGGEVGVETGDGEGSRFWFRIRADVMAEGVDARPREGAAGPVAKVEDADAGEVTAAMTRGTQAEDTREKTSGERVRPLEIDHVVPLVKEIELLLEGRKFRAVGRFQALQARVAGTGVSAEFEPIGRLVADFRFEDALTGLRRIASAHGWNAG